MCFRFVHLRLTWANSGSCMGRCFLFSICVFSFPVFVAASVVICPRCGRRGRSFDGPSLFGKSWPLLAGLTATLCCTALHCTALHCTALPHHCLTTALCCTLLHCTVVLLCNVMYCSAVQCNVQHCTQCSAVQCTVMHCAHCSAM